MRETKFSVNAVVLIAIIFSAISFFFTIRLTRISDPTAINDFHPIEGTDRLAVRYSTMDPNGIYQGDQVTGVLKLKGTYGFDWGAAVEGNYIYINEYANSELGIMTSNLVRVDMTTFEKKIVARDTILRGRYASGELVCLRGYLMPSSFPDTNSLAKLYSITSEHLVADGESALVTFIDPVSGEIVYSVRDSNALSDDFESRYLSSTLEEVKK